MGAGGRAAGRTPILRSNDSKVIWAGAGLQPREHSPEIRNPTDEHDEGDDRKGDAGQREAHDPEEVPIIHRLPA